MKEQSQKEDVPELEPDNNMVEKFRRYAGSNQTIGNTKAYPDWTHTSDSTSNYYTMCVAPQETMTFSMNDLK